MAGTRNWIADRLYEVRNRLRTRGIDVGRIDPNASLDVFLQRLLFPRLSIDCVIDVGASRGEFGTLLRRTGYGGPIVSFEPVQANYETLRARAAGYPPWTVHRYALAERDGSAEINITPKEDLNSFLTPSAHAFEVFGQWTEIIRREMVPVRRLDTLWDDLGLGAHRQVYLKTDTQGYDDRVIAGAEGVLDRVPAIQTEVSFQALYEDEPTFQALYDRITSLGYALSGLFTVWRDEHLALTEMDAVFVRAEEERRSELPLR